MKDDEVKFIEDYKFGFKDEDVTIVNTGKGLNENVRGVFKMTGFDRVLHIED